MADLFSGFKALANSPGLSAPKVQPPYPVIDQMPGSFVAEGDQPWFDGRRVNMGYKTMGFI